MVSGEGKSRRKKSLSYVDRLKLAKKSKKCRRKSRKYEEEADVESAVQQTAREPQLPPCDLSLASPRKCVSDRDSRDVSSSTAASSSTSSYHSLSLRLDDTYSNNKLSDGVSDLDEPVRLSVIQSLFNPRPGGQSDFQAPQQVINESSRWELSLNSPDQERERLRVYKLNRRKRYLARRHLEMYNVKEQPMVAMETKMAQMNLAVSPRKLKAK